MTEPIARIEAALSHLGEEHHPPAGWEARVLAATRPPARRPRWWYAGAAMAAAAAVVLVVRPRHNQRDLAIETTYRKSALVVRGDAPQVGDVLLATARGGGRHRAVWIYRNEAELVVQCPGSVQCRESEDATTAELVLTKLGDYRIVVLASSSAIDAPTGHYDADVAHARGAGVATQEDIASVR